MSGLGIDFCAGVTGPRDGWTSIPADGRHISDNGYQSFGPPQTNSSWSKSTRESHAPSFVPTVSSDGSHRRKGHHISANVSCAASSPDGKAPSRNSAAEAEILPVRKLSASDARMHVASKEKLERDSFLIPTRKAPLPPAVDTAPDAPPSSMGRRVSASAQSMMKTLGNRKKDISVPPPLPLSIKVDDAPVIHFVTLPTTKADRLSPAMASPLLSKVQKSRKKSSDEPRTPRTPILSNVMRSLKETLSVGTRRKSSSGSHLTVQVSVTQSSGPASPRDSNCSTARSAPGVEPANSATHVMHSAVVSTSSKKPIHRPSVPLVTFVKAPTSPIVRRPRTAPADRRTFEAAAGPAIASPVSPASMSTTQSPMPDLGPPVHGIFDVNYVNPWQKTYQPAPSFVSTVPMSPGESLRRDVDPMSRPTMKTEASLYKQQVLDGQAASENASPVKAPRPASFRYSQLQPASNVPSLRIADVDRLPNFLNLSPSVRSMQTSIDDFSVRLSAHGTPTSAVFASGHSRSKASRDMSMANWLSSAAFEKPRMSPIASPNRAANERHEEQAKSLDVPTQPSPEVHAGRLQDIFDQILASPAPVFQNPFLAHLATAPQEIPISAPRKSSLAITGAQISSRASSLGNISDRRQSAWSAWSNTDFPTRPTRAEVRRQSEFAGRNRGLRVSFDDGYEY